MYTLADNSVESEKTEQKKIEFNFPLLTVRTQKFSKIFDKLGSFRFSRWLSWVSLAIVPVVAAIGIYFLCSSLVTLLWTPVAREAVSDLGPASYLLLPGINPILPIFYGWLAIICALVVHEGAHGIIARNRGLNVKSSGLLFFFIVPIGAFVDVDEDQLAKAKPRDSLRVLAGGVAGNIIVAVVCILAVLLIVNGLTPAVDGVYIYDVTEGMPADVSGILPGDVFVSVDGVPIDSYDVLNSTFANKSPGDVIEVTVARGDNWEETFTTSITLTESEGRAVIGVSLGELYTQERLDFYKELSPDSLVLYMVPPSLYPGLVPFSDSLLQFYTSPLGSNWHVYANIFYWIWFVNLNVAIFNALPIYPLDGGRMLDISLKSTLARKIGEKNVSRITYAATAAIICILLMIVVIPFLF